MWSRLFIYAFTFTLEEKKNTQLTPTFIQYFLNFVENLSSILIITGF